MTSIKIKQSDGIAIRIHAPAEFERTGNDIFIDVAAIPDGTQVAAGPGLINFIQAGFDDVHLLSAWDQDDPVQSMNNKQLEDAYGERAFFRNNGPSKEVVFRETLIEDVVWNGEKFILSVRELHGGGK